LQALEGERSKVNLLYARITADPRHQGPEHIHCETIVKRPCSACPGWTDKRASCGPSSTPISANGELVMARIDELIAECKTLAVPRPSP
jgi:hypothetical protein